MANTIKEESPVTEVTRYIDRPKADARVGKPSRPKESRPVAKEPHHSTLISLVHASIFINMTLHRDYSTIRNWWLG